MIKLANLMLLRPHLLTWQWNGYARAHQDRVNLLLHLATVPLFWVGALLLVGAFAAARPALAVGWLSLWLVALVVQAKGHRREAIPAEPFLGPVDFAVRLLAEQFLTFPRYLLSDDFRRAFART